MRADVLEELDNIFSITPGEGNSPHSIQGDQSLAFPTLFPSSLGSFDDKREKKLSRAKYYNARFLSPDMRLAKNTQYIFYAQYAVELENFLSGFSI